MFEDGDAAKPFGADIVVSLSKNDAVQMTPIVACREMIKETHIKCRADRAEVTHQCMIETGEMFVIEGLNDWVGDDDGASDDRIGWRCAALNQHLVEN